jgi:hypothetical protein
MTSLQARTYQLLQWEYHSQTVYPDPFNDIELDIVITLPTQKEITIPAFWMGGSKWGVRFIPKEAGLYCIHTQCSDTKNPSLHHVTTELVVMESTQTMPPYIRVSQEKQYLVTENDKPFFWFADTWWMALSQRLSFPNDFHRLTSQRKKQHFNTIMLVAGLFPDMDSFDPRGENEEGFPWEEGYTRINPAYFDAADKRIAYLVKEGFIPCILGSWGYYLLKMGEEKMKQHWRYIIARWGCYPVVWCIAGEATMPFYLSQNRTKEMYALHEGWTRVATYIREIEPFGNPVTIHPTEIGREQLQDPSLIDFNLIQSGHNDYSSVDRTIELIRQEYKKSPHLPAILGEANYEGILKNSTPKMQRLTFWSAILNGAKGYSYGANGIWQINTPQYPFGPSPHGESWGDTPWEESLFFQGASHLSLAKQLLEQYPWWEISPHSEWIAPQKKPYHYMTPQVGGIPRKLRIVYFYHMPHTWWRRKYQMTHLEEGVYYHAFFWNPRNGEVYPLGQVTPKQKGVWSIPLPPDKEDWILVMEEQGQPSKSGKTSKIPHAFSYYFKRIVRS